MATVISPSSLWSRCQCPYRRVNSTYEADPKNTAHGNLMNVAANAAIVWTDNKLWARLRYFDNNINDKLEKWKRINTDILKQWMWKIYKFFKQYITQDYQIFQEVKFEYPFEYDWEVDLWVSWQPDVIILYNNPNREDEIVAECIDIKCWKTSRYSKPDIRTENSQRYFYLWFLFHHFALEFKEHNFEKPKIKFSFAVVDKWTWDLELFSKTLDEYTVELQMKHHIKEFRELQKKNLDKKDYPATKCRWCAFCEFADICPLKKDEILVSNNELNELF